MLVSLARAKRWLGIPAEDTSRDDLVLDALEGAQSLVAGVCGREGLEQAERRERVDGSGRDRIYVSHAPVTAIASISFDERGAGGEGTPLSSLRSWTQLYASSTPPAIEDVETDSVGGLRRVDGSLWPNGRANILVEYTAGYTEASLPADLRMLILQVAALHLGRRGKEGVQSVSLDGFSTTFRSPEPGEVLSLEGASAIIQRYKRSAV